METFEKERNQPIHQWVYQVLRNNIIKLNLRPAQQISENEVSEALCISRTPVREAFIRLAEEGLLHVTPQKRSIVSRIDLEQAEEARFVRRALEKAVLREACENSAEHVRADLLQNLESQLECLRANAYDRMLLVDNDFHRIIFRGSGKERSWLYIKKLDYNYDRLRVMVLPRVMDQVVIEHRRILEIILERNVEHIEEIVDLHLSCAMIRKAVYEYPPQYFVQDLRAGAAAPHPGEASRIGSSS